jgi:mono/diheme cytochrome c family protein
MKLLVKLLTAVLVVAFLATTAFGAEGGNPRKGKALFKKTCKECHSKGAAGGEVTPLTKTMSQWDRFFEKNEHNPEPLKSLSEQDLKDIQQFLYDHAADSPQPQTCG